MVTWIIQTDLLHGKLSYKILNAVTQAGHTLITYEGRVTTDTEFMSDIGFFDEGSGSIVAYGTQAFIKKAWQYPWYPGAYPNGLSHSKNLDTNCYMVHYDLADILNHDYMFASAQELVRNIDLYAKLFGNQLFIKDILAYKRFPASMGHRDDICTQIKLLLETEVLDPHSLIMVSSRKQNLVSEHRFIIVNRAVVAHSTYKYQGTLDIRVDVPKKALEFASRLAQQHSPIDCYSLDVAMIDDGSYHSHDIESATPKLLECNSFSSSGLYACDVDAVVKAVSDQAQKDYLALDFQ